MSKSATDKSVNEASKQLIGSSKRKRKSSIIKRNIQVNETNESDKPPRNEKTYSKKPKIEKIKKGRTTSIKEITETPKSDLEPNSNEDNEGNSSNLDPNQSPEGNSAKKDIAEETSICDSKEQCRNCNFCSKHKSTDKDSDSKDSKDESREKKKFTCDVCAKMGLRRIYGSAEKHKQHMTLMHETPNDELKKFECTECPEPVWFPTKSKYSYHLGAKHPGIIKFICEVCTQTFKLKANYKNHLKTHNIVVQKKFSCDVCNGTFVNRAGYEAHKKRFPGPHIKQSCSHCGFSFSRERHMKNHRCKKLLLEEAAAQANKRLTENEGPTEIIMNMQPPITDQDTSNIQTEIITMDDKMVKEVATETEVALLDKKNSTELETNKRVVLHRVIPRRNQEETIFRPVQMQAQTLPEQVMVQELREIDLENGAFITTDSEQQIILRDVNGHIVQGNQILQLDLNDVQPGEESQVYVADWNLVAPIVIREKSP